MRPRVAMFEGVSADGVSVENRLDKVVLVVEEGGRCSRPRAPAGLRWRCSRLRTGSSRRREAEPRSDLIAVAVELVVFVVAALASAAL